MRLGDLALGILVLICGAALFHAGAQFSPIPGQVYGAQTLPRLIGMMAMVVGLALIVTGWARRDTEGLLRLSDWARDPRAWARLLAAGALIVGYILLSGTLGFVLTAFLMLLALLLLSGTRPMTAVIVAIGAVIVVQYSFGSLMRVPLPRGDLLPWP